MTQSLPPKSLVLYADDDIDDIEMIVTAFDELSQNVELITFADGLQLLHYVQNIDSFQPVPCLIILDINMPMLTGKETLIKLRTINGYEDVPAILYSTSSMPADIVFAKNYNAGFITKPLVTQQVRLIIDQMIDNCTDEVKKRIRK